MNLKHRSERGIGVLLIVLGISTAAFMSVGYLGLRTEKRRLQTEQEASENFKAFYSTEVYAWHAYVRHINGQAPLGAAGSAAGRTLAAYPWDLATDTASIPADSYSAAAYVDGTSVNGKATAALDSDKSLTSFRATLALESWKKDTATDDDFCASTQSRSQSRTKTCLVAMNLPPGIDLKIKKSAADPLSDGPIDLTPGGSAILNWTGTSLRPNSCTLTTSALPGPAVANSGSQNITANFTTTYTINCRLLNNTPVSDSVVVKVINVVLNPSGAQNHKITNTLNLSWTSSEMKTCSLTREGTEISKLLSGTLAIPNITAPTSFQLACVDVNDAPQIRTLTLTMVGRWFQVDSVDCGTYCTGRGFRNIYSSDRFYATDLGAKCGSGERRPATMWEDGITFTHGCWSYCSPTISPIGPYTDVKSYGIFCYAPGNQDGDPTDLTIACFCGP